ncbi:MAG: tRNA (N(6)-L-threonylcarbamoyladenosine(37)-C(2))-methylthiotransferase MtaB [Lachnospiraceae bacterium]|nr:tRNA (N(6)-L-threonylcarbamoyladenosine(37)-C(2))-methylthiotransferase MtaB [Lachnospiraceae bacterium]
MRKKAAFHNLGCRVNAYETEAMAEALQREGYEIVPFEPGADVYVINTCTVTNIADRKSRQMLHRAKEMNPLAVVVAVGCYVEAGKAGEKDEAIDLAVGNNAKSRLPELLDAYFRSKGEEAEAFGTINSEKSYEELQISTAEGRARAFVKIQDGCNQFCTYCLIPYVRGRVRSRSAEDVLEEIRRLAETGYQEVILTGIHVSSYGSDFDEPDQNRQTPEMALAKTNYRLLDLVQRAAEIPGIKRLRFGSLEPGIMTDEFTKALSEIPAICPQFHLSLQSGSNATLQRMGRKYNAEEYAEVCERLRNYFEHPAITTDVIAGFPGETDEEAEETLRFVHQVKFAGMHIFKYSMRNGTKAASMKGQVPEQLKKTRSAVLIEAEKQERLAYAGYYEGKEVEVLFEETVTKNGQTLLTGHTRESLVAVTSAVDQAEEHQIRRCFVEGVLEDGSLQVKPLDQTAGRE